MMFAGFTAIATGQAPTVGIRNREIAFGILRTSSEECSAFLIAEKDSPGKFEWRLYAIPLMLHLARRETRLEHVAKRKLQGFRFRVLVVDKDALGMPYVGAPMTYTAFLGERKTESRKFFGRTLW